MLGPIRELQSLVTRLESALRKTKGAQVQQGGTRNQAKTSVDFYFRTCRPTFVALGITNDALASTDALMQSLLDATHHNTSVSRYRTIVKATHVEIIELEKILLMRAGAPTDESGINGTDKAIIETLSKLLPSAARSYQQAIIDLKMDSRLSWRGPATDLREALRETLDHLAPDAEVIAQPGFKLEVNTHGPTMKQKVRCILRKRGMTTAAIETPQQAVQAVEESVGSFVRSVYTRSSVSTHTPTEKREIVRIRDWVRAALCELLEIA